MTRRSSTSTTGTRLRRLAAASFLIASVASVSPGDAHAQSLKLRSLRLPAQDLVGTWVSYHGRSQSRGTPVREFEQRLSVVGKQNLGGGKWGLWVELKTREGRSAARIERGFYAPASLRGTDLLGGGDGSQIPGGTGDAPPADAPSANETPANEASGAGEFVLLRYQVLTTGGKLYEYPVGSTRHSRASGDVASFELFEYDPEIRPVHSTIGPDTLVLGRRLVPATVDQTVRHGTDRWPHPADPSREAHLVLTQRYWRNPAVPLTGYARSLFRAEIAAVEDSAGAPDSLAGSAPGVPAAPGAASADSVSAAPADSAATSAAPPDSASIAPAAPAAPGAATGAAAAADVLAWTELTLVDIGADARPEVNQEPELAPDIEESEHDPSGYQR